MSNALPGDVTALVDQTAALGGSLGDELTATLEAIEAVNNWRPPIATDISSVVYNGGLTAANAAEVLTDAMNQPTVNGHDLRVKAKAALVKQFTRQVAGPGGDHIIESIRPAFVTSCTAMAEAANLVSPTDRVDILADADDDTITAWRTIGEHRVTLDQVSALVRVLVERFEVLGGPQPWHGARWIDAAMYTPDVARLTHVGRALSAPSGTGGPRGGRWHAISSAIRLNTVSEARAILADAHAAHREAEAADHEARHGTLTDGNGQRPRAAV